MVASYLKERHSTWDEKLPKLLFALNTTVQSSTGMSPALLLYGRQPEPPGTQRQLQEPQQKPQLTRKAELDERSGLRPCQSCMTGLLHKRESLRTARLVITTSGGENPALNRVTKSGSVATHSPQPPRA